MEKARRPLQIKPVLGLAGRLLVGFAFLYAGLNKAQVPQEFLAALEHYPLIPLWAYEPTALLLPYIEIFAGIAFLAGFLTRISGSILGGLSTFFILLLSISMATGNAPQECGCFGGALSLEPHWTILVDIILAGLSIAGIFWGKEYLSIDRWMKNRQDATGGIGG